MSTCEVSNAALEADKKLLPKELSNGSAVNKDVEQGDDYESYDKEDESDRIDDSEMHPLQNEWALWFFKNDRNNEWTDNLKKVINFTTVENFWSLINHITPACHLPSGCDYSLFKSGVEPMWEDKANRKGGRWCISLDKQQRTQLLNTYWLDLMMLLIGEAFNDDSDEICGAVVNIRNKGDRLSLWTADCENKDAIMRIGHKIKDSLKLKLPISYQSHEDQQHRTGSKTKCTYNL